MVPSKRDKPNLAFPFGEWPEVGALARTRRPGKTPSPTLFLTARGFASRIVGIAMIATLACCSPTPAKSPAAAPASQPSGHPVTGLPVAPLTVRHGAHRFHFRVEVARTTEQQARGLMFRQAMGADEGMIFPMRPPRYASFWMHNTVLPLDIVFIGTDGRIISIAQNATPYSDAPIRAGELTGAVLELNGGRAAQLGIEPGDRVEW